MAKIRAFPDNTRTYDENIDNVTDVDAQYMDDRDAEIEAIEKALGSHLVANWTGTGPVYPLSALVKVPDNGDLLLAYNGGNVGIGTSLHSSTLDVRGDATFGGGGSDRIQVGNYGNSFAFNRNIGTGNIFNSGAHAYQLNHTGKNTVGENDYLAWQVYNASGSLVTAQAFVITGLGNIGIGTATPISKFDVGGDVTFGGGASDRIQLGNFGNSFAFNRNISTGTLFNSGAHAYQLNHTGKSTVGANDYLAWQVYNASGSLVTAQAFAITGQGNIGIGTTTPQALLDVRGNARIGQLAWTPGDKALEVGGGLAIRKTSSHYAELWLDNFDATSGARIQNAGTGSANYVSLFGFVLSDPSTDIPNTTDASISGRFSAEGRLVVGLPQSPSSLALKQATVYMDGNETVLKFRVRCSDGTYKIGEVSLTPES